MKPDPFSLKHPLVSIIVIVYDMEKTIRKCLDSLVNLDYPKDYYEIIVVDGGSTDGTQGIVRGYVRKYGVRMFVEGEKIRGYARNLGLMNAKGEIVAFIDADCVADKRWLITHIRDQMDDQVGAVGGSIKRLSKNESSFDVKSHILTQDQEGEYSCFSPKRCIAFIPTCNASFKREVLKEVGYFNERLHVAEDTELCWRIIKNGYKILFDPDALIIHQDDYKPKEISTFLFMTRFFKHGNSYFQIQQVQKRLKYSLPISTHMIFLLFPGIVVIRAARYLHKMRFIKWEHKWFKVIPYVLLSSICWVSGYLHESLKY